MLHQLISFFDKSIKIKSARAHCDIPCKIYDPATAQFSALSVIRFMDLISNLDMKEKLSVSDQAQLVRLVSEKEIHAEKAKHEVRVIWGDYIKQTQFEKYPDISSLVHRIMLAGSACKQGIEREKGENLLSLINEFSEAFWATKSIDTYTAVCPYLPEEVVVYPKLK